MNVSSDNKKASTASQVEAISHSDDMGEYSPASLIAEMHYIPSPANVKPAPESRTGALAGEPTNR